MKIKKVKIINIMYKNDYIKYLTFHNLINEYCIWNVKNDDYCYYLIDVPIYSHGYWIEKENCELVEEIPNFTKDIERILEI